MVKTYNQAENELQKGRRDRDEENAPEDEEFTQRSPYQFGGERIEDLADEFPIIAQLTPENLIPDSEQADVPDIGPDIGIDLGDVLNELESLSDIDLTELSERGLLEVIARGTLLLTRLGTVDVQTQVRQLEALFSIATSVEPSRLVTVTGINTIDDADVPEPVIPQSDKTDVPTRTIFLRAGRKNQNPIVLGDDDIDPDEGFYLMPGEYMTLEIDFREDQLYMASETAGDSVALLGVI